VQYVPTAFGLGGANLPACRWLLRRARNNRDDIRVMFHEPYFEFGWTPLHQAPLSLVQRWMARVLERASSQTYLSTDAWRAYLSPSNSHPPFITMPIPSAIPRSDKPADALEQRAKYLGSAAEHLVGHFGTYGTHVAPLLQASVIALLSEDPQTSMVCTGAGSDAFAAAVVAATPALKGRVQGTGRVAPSEVAAILCGCDILLQPYIDGVTTRRTSVMAGLINGRPVVTTAGRLTEAVWSETYAAMTVREEGATALASAVRTLLADESACAALAARGDQTYRERFSLAHTIRALRTSAKGAAA
jgi:glycosyltransferase involved in cell wall biosynthesis